MRMLKRVVERAVNKRGYPIFALIVAGIFDVYGAYTFYKGLPGHNATTPKPAYSQANSQTGNEQGTKAGKTEQQPVPQSIDDAVEQTAAAQQPEEKNIKLAEPFPEYNSRLANSSWQNIEDNDLEKDIVDNMARLLVETYKDKDGKQRERWRKEDDPVKLAFESAVSKLTQYMNFFNRYSKTSKLPRNLALAVSTAECGGDAGDVSGAGAAGLFQVMEGTAKDLKIKMNDYFDMRFDPKESIRGGTEYLSKLIDKYGGRVDFALAAYNAGPARLDGILDSISKEHGIDKSSISWSMLKQNLPEETRNYVVRVLSRKIIFDMLYEDLNLKWQPLLSEKTMTYKIGPKETLSSVARIFNVTLPDVYEVNPQLVHADKVIPGMLVNVPID